MSEERIVQRGYRVSGRVQGVFFRAWTRDTAREMGLAGTVKNLLDGSVEAHFRGPEAAVEKMAERLWEGSPASHVEDVESVESGQELESNDFRILY